MTSDVHNRAVTRSKHSLSGGYLHQASIETDEYWMVSNMPGKALLAWDSRGHNVRTIYDALRHPTDTN
jgi:hypothetical protein